MQFAGNRPTPGNHIYRRNRVEFAKSWRFRKTRGDLRGPPTRSLGEEIRVGPLRENRVGTRNRVFCEGNRVDYRKSRGPTGVAWCRKSWTTIDRQSREPHRKSVITEIVLPEEMSSQWASGNRVHCQLNQAPARNKTNSPAEIPKIRRTRKSRG